MSKEDPTSCEKTSTLLDDIKRQIRDKDNLIYDMASVIRDYVQIVDLADTEKPAHQLFINQAKRKAQEALDRMGTNDA